VEQQSVFETDDFVWQVRQAARECRRGARRGGWDASPDRAHDVVHHDKAEYRAAMRDVGRVYREVIGAHYPAMTLVQVAALLEDRAKVEIEATAVIAATK